MGRRSSYMTLLTRQASAEGFLVPQFGGQSPQGIHPLHHLRGEMSDVGVQQGKSGSQERLEL